MGHWGARITIDYPSQKHVCDRNFWPAPLYARQWIFRDQPRDGPARQGREQQWTAERPTVLMHENSATSREPNARQ